MILWALSVIISVWLMDGGLLHPELQTRLPIYLSDTSLFRIIFDSGMDPNPRPRQVSFVFDVVDAYFVQACARLGYPHFLSFTHYLFILFIALALWRFMNRYVTSDKRIGFLVVALLLSSRCFELATFFRTAKVGASLVMALTINLLADLLTWPALAERPSTPALDQFATGWFGTRRPIFVYCGLPFVLCFVGALFDEQCAFMTVLVITILLAWALTRRAAVCALAAGASFVSLGFVFGYYRWAFPKLYAFVNQSTMNYDFQTSIPIEFLKLEKVYRFAFELLIDTTRALFGNMTRFQVVATLVVLLGLVFVTRKPARPTPAGEVVRPADRWAVLLFVAVLGALYVLNVVMIVKHPPVVWPDVRVSYYWMPATTCLAFLVPWMVARVRLLVPMATSPRATWLVAGLVAMIGANLWSLPADLQVLRSGHLSGEFAWTKVLLAALVDPDKARDAYGSTSPAADPVYVLLKGPSPAKPGGAP